MKLSPTRRRRGIIGLTILAVFTVVGFFVLPPIVRAQLEKRLSAELGRRVTLEKVRLNPYSLSATLEKFTIHEQDGTTRFLGWDRLFVNFDALSSLGGDWVLSEVMLEGFSAEGIVNADRSLNISDLLAKFEPAPDAPESSPRPVRVGHLQVSNARFALTDHSQAQPFATIVGPFTFDLTGFRTVSERGAPYRFTAVTEAGEILAWSGTLRAEPFQSIGELRVENIVLSKYAPYYSSHLQADLADGKLSVRGRYALDLTDDKRVMRLEDGAVQLRDLVLREPNSGEIVLSIPSIDLSGMQADALAASGSVASIVIAGGQIAARREQDGSINLLTMLSPPASAAAGSSSSAPTTPPPPSPLPAFTIGEFTLKDFAVAIADHAAPRTARLALNALSVSARNITFAENAETAVQVSFNWAPAGTVRLDGNVQLAARTADLRVDVANFEILPLSPYLESFANVRVTGGSITTAMTARASQRGSQPVDATVSGDFTVHKLGLVDGARNEELAGFGELTLRGLRAQTSPQLHIALEEVSLAGPYARIVVNEDRSLNLAAIVPPDAEAVSAETNSPGAAAPLASSEKDATAPAALPVTIGRIVLSDGDFRFTDHSLKPGVTMVVSQFGGTITGLSPTSPTKGDVDLKAVVDGAGPISITGKLDPLSAQPQVDIKLDGRNVDLVPLSPYSGKFAGYELARGKLALDMKLLVDGDRIDSANVITLHQFTFGQRIESPDATKLPVKLGVALLKDLDGKIVIDIPVQGSVADPNFRIGRVVGRVIVNLLTKAAVSPFSLLGAAFGGGGEELGFQEFAPGSAELQPTEIRKLDTMIKALTNRPALGVGLEGSYDVSADTHALKRSKFADQIRRSIWERKHAVDLNIPPPTELVISPEENAAAVKALFDETFPPGTEFGIPLPEPPEVIAPPPPPAGLFKRIVRAITFKPQREARAARLENDRRAAEHQAAVDAARVAGLPVEEMTGRLAETILVTENDLRALAQTRAERVRDYFVTTGKIAADRLFLASGPTNVPAADAKNTGRGPRVFLLLQ